jgi:hypothetical protein
MKRTMAFGAALQQGTWPVQEDGFFVDPIAEIYVVGDGFGGRGAGDIAVKLALEEIRNQKRESGFGTDLISRIHQKISKRNESLPISRKGGCSFAMAEARDGVIYLSQIGVCSIFLFRAGRIFPVLLPQSAPRKEYQPLMADFALGLPGELQFEKRRFPMESGDLLGICSGGLDWENDSFGLAFREQMNLRAMGDDLSSVASHLVENTDLSSQGWNRTLVLIEKT